MIHRAIRILCVCGAIALPVLAEELQTDWIQPVTGAEEKTLGASLRAVETSAEDGSTRVTIAIPKASVADTADIQEVIVVGQRPDKSEPTLDVRHEWVADYDKDYYGLVLYLGKDGNIPLRLYLKSDQ